MLFPVALDGLSTAGTLADRLRSAIIEGLYLPGDRITERELCGRFSASRPSIREALRQLEAERLIEIAPHRGPSVRFLSEAEFHDLWEIRMALDCLVARRFASHGTVEERQTLADSINALDLALKSKDRRAIREAKNAFFNAFFAGAHSEPLASYSKQINSCLSGLWMSSLNKPGRPEESIYELGQLLTAIQARNADAAEAAIRLYNYHAINVGLDGLKRFLTSIGK